MDMLPNIADITNQMNGATIFTKTDLLKGYFQIPIVKEDIEKTVIITSLWHLHFQLQLFGLGNAWATFQRLMDDCWWTFPSAWSMPMTSSYLDPTSSNILKDVKRVLQILKENRLEGREDKCEWAKKMVEFLGHQISPDSIKPLPGKSKSLTLMTDASSTAMGAALELDTEDGPEHSCTIKYLKGSVNIVADALSRNCVNTIQLGTETTWTYSDCGGTTPPLHGVTCQSTLERQPLPAKQGYRYLFTIIDRNARWPEAIPIWQQTAESCAKALIGCVSRHGVPQIITSHRGGNFTSAFWNALADGLGTRIIHTMAYNPEVNSIIERLHQSLKASLTTRCQGGS
ncbi:uncharacterized protein [Macrobrachium rosenbergii]|uniref:uncharacterized protein n=1 Tax=Macrobrachium rosenbergii TaxID=79674 RepID=UPI0034D6DF6E